MQSVCAKKIKCQVGEKYLCTGEEKCYNAILTVYEMYIGQGNQNKEVIDKVLQEHLSYCLKCVQVFNRAN